MGRGGSQSKAGREQATLPCMPEHRHAGSTTYYLAEAPEAHAAGNAAPEGAAAALLLVHVQRNVVEARVTRADVDVAAVAEERNPVLEGHPERAVVLAAIVLACVTHLGVAVPQRAVVAPIASVLAWREMPMQHTCAKQASLPRAK